MADYIELNHQNSKSVTVNQIETTNDPPTYSQIINEQEEPEEGGGGRGRDHVHIEDSSKKSTKFMATMNFTNSIIGAGIMGIPYAFKQSGFISAILLLIVLTFIVGKSIELLIKSGERTVNADCYQSLMYELFGRIGFFAVSVFMFLFAFGAMIAYLIIIADNVVPVILHLTGVEISRFIVLTVSVLALVAPLSFKKEYSSLGKASLFSMVAVLLLVAIVSIQAPVEISKSDNGFPSIIPFLNRSHVFKGISVMSFAFVCHHNSFMIYNSLSHKTERSFQIVTFASLLISLIACLLLGISGYVSFGDQVEANILNCFKDSVIINVARFVFAVTMVFTYPLELLVCRKVITTAINRESSLVRNSITVILLVISFVIAASVRDLGIVLELTGSISATMIAYIFPPMCYLYSHNDITLTTKVWCILLIEFGVTVMIISTGQTISSFNS